MTEPIHGVRRTDGEPHEPLTQIADRILAAFEGQVPEGTKLIAFVNDGERGGIGMHGYEDPVDAVADLFLHLRALFHSMGKELGFLPIDGNPTDN